MSDKKAKKKKDRERRVRQKVLARRTAVRAGKKKQEAEKARLEAEFSLKNGKPEPHLNDLDAVAARREQKARQAREKLEHNLKILEALEAEYAREREDRAELNRSLEAEGHTTLKAKLEALIKKSENSSTGN